MSEARQSRARHGQRTRALLFAGAATAYAATATPGAFWLDSSELAGAGVILGVPHAPGHPLYVILAHAAALIPIGTVGFRVAMLSALCAALAVALTHALVTELTDDDAPAWPATLAALAVALSQAVWLQAVRAEVYTLELALALGLLVYALRWVNGPTPRHAGVPLAAAFAVGLGAGNHHLLLAFHLPALALLLGADPGFRRNAIRRLPVLVLAGLYGLAVYALLPLRAATGPLINYGDPSSLARLVDMITARVFMRSVTAAHTPMLDNLSAALDMFILALGPALLVAAAAGLAVLSRRRPLAALALTLALLGNLATKVTMDLDPTNPDAAGYFEVGIAITATLSAVAFAAAARSRQPVARLGSALVAVLCLGLLLTDAALRLPRTDLSDYRTPQSLDAALVHRVEPDALVLSSFFALHFNRLYQQSAEGVRPDILAVHQGFEDHVEGGRPLVERLRARDPRLAPVLDQFLATQAFPTQALMAHADQRPVYLEPTVALPVPADRLQYAGGLFRVLPSGVAPTPALDEQAADQALLLRLASPELRGQREARTTLSILWLQVAVVRLQQGVGAGARLALDLVEEFSPGLPQLATLRPMADALADAPGPREASQVRAAIARFDFASLFR
ncbi:MAG: DUF2723 domain-containing protein [Myxococcota bacterium]